MGTRDAERARRAVGDRAHRPFSPRDWLALAALCALWAAAWGGLAWAVHRAGRPR